MSLANPKIAPAVENQFGGWPLRKARAIFSIWIQDGLAYRTAGIIWVLTDVSTAITMPLVWAAAARTTGGMIAGYSIGNMIVYYLAMLLMTGFVTSHIMWDVANEIRDGLLSLLLVRPVDIYWFTFLRNLAWRLIRPTLFFPFFLVLLYIYRGYLGDVHLCLAPEFWLALLLGHLLSFTVVMAMSGIALYTQEAYSIFEIYYIPQLFLSGVLFPIEVMPGWCNWIAKVLPFYYTLGAPTEIFIGRVQGAAAWNSVGMQAFWVVVAFFLGRLVWRSGLKQFTGVGM
jgi:ABC-2 type transport system permease protein